MCSERPLPSPALRSSALLDQLVRVREGEGVTDEPLSPGPLSRRVPSRRTHTPAVLITSESQQALTHRFCSGASGAGWGLFSVSAETLRGILMHAWICRPLPLAVGS